MHLDRVTITGADDSVEPADLLLLARMYPFVEWGILVSAKQIGNPRFPSMNWIAKLQLMAARFPIDLSLHVCGRWVRELLLGRNNLPFMAGVRGDFQRMQLNFHAETLEYDGEKIEAILDATCRARQIIFQIDGNLGQVILADVDDGKTSLDCVPLFDCSHGAGVLPGAWPSPFDPDTYHGYAGGLGPDNLAEQIPLIGKAAGETRFWIDMETRVRSVDDRQFDLDKVRRCLEIAQPFVRKAGA